MQKLSLKDNCLSDTGVKKLTLPQRLLKDGLGKLSVLDLSLNPKMSDNSIKYLVKINSLTALNLSGTGVTLTSGVPKLVDCTNLCLTPKVHCMYMSRSNLTLEGGLGALYLKIPCPCFYCVRFGYYRECNPLTSKPA